MTGARDFGLSATTMIHARRCASFRGLIEAVSSASTYGHLLEREAPDCAPWQVRRAEDHIEANWQEGITLESLAEVTGVSGFSLFRAFRKSRGYSPFQYASQVRSKHHRRA
jgi:AraC-like DNA-binding protein